MVTLDVVSILLINLSALHVIQISNVCIYYYCVFKSNLCLHSTIEERPYECSICEEAFYHPQCVYQILLFSSMYSTSHRWEAI